MTAEELQQKYNNGQRIFTGVTVVKNEGVKEMMQQHRPRNMWRGEALSSQKANIHGNFSSVNLQGASIEGLSFSNVDFCGANFTGAFLYRIDFHNSKFKNVSFNKASIQNVIFLKTDLEQVDFTQSSIYEVTFQDADLQESNFDRAIFDRVSFQDCNLNNAYFKSEFSTEMNLYNTHIIKINY
jgi:uncharacterized protein YjbI with pentapeptide repeats